MRREPRILSFKPLVAAGLSALLFAALGWRWLNEDAYRPALNPPAQAFPGARASLDRAHAAEANSDDAHADTVRPDAGAVRRSVGAVSAPDAAASELSVEPPLVGVENVLLIGLDKHRGVRRGGRTDTLIVASFRVSDERLGLISVPRDLYVPIDGHDHNRINAVYGLAQLDGKDPLRELTRVVSDTVGLPVEHAVAIDLGVFEQVIDAVGGVTVHIDCGIVDSFIDPRLDGGRRRLELGAGMQQLDGVTAAMFIRSRHGRSDWSRARRQQLVLRGLRDRLRSPLVITRVPELLRLVERSVVTDLSRLQLLGLARRVLAQDPTRLHGIVLGHRETTPHRTERGSSVLLAEPDQVRQRVAELFDAPPPGTREAQTECLPADVALRRPRHSGARASGPPKAL